MSDWNQQIIDEFRANGGRVGGQFTGASLILLHHRGRRSGREFVAPLAYQPVEGRDDAILVVASMAGAPVHPEWYHNLLAAGKAQVETGTETYEATVRDLPGAERDEAFERIVARFPGFRDYERKTAGIRTIPVLELTRA
ncbi:nitroreductase/quinone reductase family protein [Actinoplanes sp. NPDC020271]|uniref:nitroreductase/quinone reductase family protein n=1 Tax=Actinoplanes sp. NPDC020271 TaxID=3363896 RepID=UPI0037A3F76B